MRRRYTVRMKTGSSFKSSQRHDWCAEYNFAKMISKIIGAKYVAIAKSWIPTLAVWGTAGGVALVHFTDWRLFLDYVPYISGKFKRDE